MHHCLLLCTDAHSDLNWWLAFLPTWSGTSYILESSWSTSPSMSLYTDASGSLGWGAYWSGRRIQADWSPDQLGRDIAWKKLFAIASAVNTWGHHWPQKKVLVHCDNQAVVDIWKKRFHSLLTSCPHALYLCSTAQHAYHSYSH